MKQSSWPDVMPINQKNYYTDYMKRDDQILPLRLQNEANRDRIVQSAKDRDRERALNPRGEVPLLAEDVQEEMGAAADEDGTAPAKNDPSHIIVIHPGSQNLRIGFASDALPKTIPMTLATRFPQTESEQYEALPRRQFEAKTSEEQYGEEWSKKYTKQSSDLKIDMRANKRKVLPNSKELVVNYNRRADPEIIPVHNDPLQVEWTDIKSLEDPNSVASCFIGNAAQRVPDDSNPKFKLWWPMQCGWLNEDDYTSKEHLYDDFETLLDKTIRQELGLNKNSAWKQYSCVFVIPDLYDKRYVEQALRSCMNWFEFSKVCFIQESMAATFGAGYTQACVVDVGAQKTSITCVEDGLCLEDSRINLKYGGYDVTETFIKMMLFDNFPYADINLRRRHDFLLAEELKVKHCTMTQAEISVQLFQFHLRAPNQPTRKYQFKTYDEVILAPMGFYDPEIFDNSTKLRGRRKIIDRSYNPYEVEVPDDPLSAAQTSILALSKPSINQLNQGVNGAAPAAAEFATPMKEKPNPFNNIVRDGTPQASNAPSPAPEGASTPPQIQATPAPQGMFADPSVPVSKLQAIERDSVLPIAPLDTAIMISIQYAAKGDEKKTRDLMGSIMVIGGGAKIPHFTTYLEERLRARRPDIADRVLVSRSARDMDEQVVVWKGASVFGKLSMNDSWITPIEYERLGPRTLHHKVLWSW
ncbi:hypothetical protein M406DRAFT_76623 [Cryphonectria parasitica EP155]|uniref:Actin-related protein 8 n=1 Tax=Cryphonectria parasitica (strain ATCC 38755 / EP155) TaxID=660469 RepID=A0A9P4YBX9_CRYP1|nr:uncharacterized protein M406DRAFT_76623 [Cryphonectria parasitica EP155]KAF3769845.1 hypothetical protein M406DRAFT_76623 [Cryphonectria parasitica EP155]